MSNSKMIISEQGLIKVSKELINKRTYVSSLITSEGSPFVTDGVASALNGTNYFLYNGLDLTGITTLKIDAKGKFASSGNSSIGQCLWSLQDNEYNVLSLQFFTDKLQIVKEDIVLAEIDSIVYSTDEVVNISLELTNTEYKIILIKDGEYTILNGSLSQAIDVTSWTSVRIGTLAHGSSSYWSGAINLADFIIYKDNVIYYTPSVDPTFNFTKILVSDGTISLTDSSAPVLNHIYEFSVTEIQRTGSNVLLTAQIGGSAHLNIVTIGLYSTGADGTKLFAEVDGLAIKKTSDLGYNLIFTVKMNLGVVNTVALPEIIVVSEDQPVKRDFITLERVYTYLVTNLERCIVLNATELGRERDQNVFQLENTYELQQANYNSSKIFADIKKKIHETESATYNSAKITQNGTPTISTDGVVSDISISDYVRLNSTQNKANSWEFKTVFTSSAISGAIQTIACFSSTTQEPPLVLGINSSGKCFLELNKLENITILNTSLATPGVFNRNPSRDLSISSTSYFAWENSIGSSWTNSHVTLAGNPFNDNGTLSGFSTSNYATTPSTFDLSEDFTLVFSFVTGATGTRQGILSSGTGDYYIDVTLGTDGKLIYNFGDGTQWLVPSGSDVGTSIIAANTNHFLKIVFDGTIFTSYVSIDNGQTYDQDWTYSISGDISTCNIKFGVNNSSEAWDGSVNLNNASLVIGDSTVWNGTLASNCIYTTTLAPTTASQLYDGSGFLFNYSTITATDKGAFIDEELFMASIGQKYYVKVSYDGSSYLISYSVDDKYYVKLYTLSSSTLINFIQEVDFGVTKSPEGTSEPFYGSIYLQGTRFELDGVDKSPVDIVKNNKCLKDFYSFVDPKRSVYYINNLSGLEFSRIRVIEDNIEGGKDLIDFSSSDGFSLCVKAYLKETSDKVILTKMNLEDDEKYFVLKLENSELIFNLYTDNNIITLSKTYTSETLVNIISTPILISIVYSGTDLKMYVNNTLEKTITGTITGFLTADSYTLYNVEDPDDIADTNYVEGIASFNGVLTSDDIHYLTNVTSSGYNT